MLLAPTIYVEKSTVKGNVVMVGNGVYIAKDSVISSQTAGCTFNGDIPGMPSLFVSHSFSCGLGGGSFGGRGGVGISDNRDDTIECIKNAYSRMSVYGFPLLTGASGSPGSPYSVTDRPGTSPGAISIIGGIIYLDSASRIQGGYLPEYKGTPSSSGGSVSLIAPVLSISGAVTANGQSADSDTSGEGSGGRISLLNPCWANIGPNAQNFSYNFSQDVFEAKPGQRKPLPDSLSDLQDVILAAPGSIAYSPCLPGRTSISCTSCEIGSTKFSLFEPGCQKCDIEDVVRKKDYKNTFNTCEVYACQSKYVQLSQIINPYCLTSYEVFSNFVINNPNWFIYAFAVMTALLLFATFNRKFKLTRKLKAMCSKKQPVQVDIEATPVHIRGKRARDGDRPCNGYDSEIAVLAFQGENLPDSQWFLEMEVGKDFVSPIDKQEYLSLTREINQTAKWKQKYRIWYFIGRLIPPFKEFCLKKARRGVAKNIGKSIEGSNLQREREGFNADKQYELGLWTSDDFSVAQLLIIHKNIPIKQPFSIEVQFSGELDLDNPLKIKLHRELIETHLNLVCSDEDRITLSHQIRESLYNIGLILEGVFLHDSPICFAYKMLTLIDALEAFNRGVGAMAGLRASFIVIEELKLRYQKLKYRYNQVYQVKSKLFDRIESLRKKLVEFSSLKDKFTYQFCLFLTPTDGKVKPILSSEKDDQVAAKLM